MEENKNAALAISDILIDAINKKYDSVRDLNSIKVNIEEEGFDDMNPVIDSIIEEENNHIGKLQQLVDLLSGGEEEIAEGKEETIDMIDNSNEFVESMTTMKKKLRLNENFDNVIDDVQAVADPVFVGANKEHDENKKKYEDAIEENKKEAEDTIPKEGETGKKVTSKELKAMKLSEELFDNEVITEDLSGTSLRDLFKSVYNSLEAAIKKFEATTGETVSKDDLDSAVAWFVSRFHRGEELGESVLKESCDGWIAMYNGQKLEIPKSDANGIYDAKQKAIKELNVPKSKLGMLSIKPAYNESLQVKIAKEQMKRFNEGKMPKDWNVDAYLERLTEKKHISKEEAKSLKEWYSSSNK